LGYLGWSETGMDSDKKAWFIDHNGGFLEWGYPHKSSISEIITIIVYHHHNL
jgi:hypothetical protein